MTRDEYDALPLSEAEVTFNRDPGLRTVYVVIKWDGAFGIKFPVAEEFLSRLPDTKKQAGEVFGGGRSTAALDSWQGDEVEAEALMRRLCASDPRADVGLTIEFAYRAMAAGIRRALKTPRLAMTDKNWAQLRKLADEIERGKVGGV